MFPREPILKRNNVEVNQQGIAKLKERLVVISRETKRQSDFNLEKLDGALVSIDLALEDFLLELFRECIRPYEILSSMGQIKLLIKSLDSLYCFSEETKKLDQIGYRYLYDLISVSLDHRNLHKERVRFAEKLTRMIQLVQRTHVLALTPIEHPQAGYPAKEAVTQLSNTLIDIWTNELKRPRAWGATIGSIGGFYTEILNLTDLEITGYPSAGIEFGALPPHRLRLKQFEKQILRRMQQGLQTPRVKRKLSPSN